MQKELIAVASLAPVHFKYIAELNAKYCDRPGDFADLSIVALSARFGFLNVVSLDADFDVYRA